MSTATEVKDLQGTVLAKRNRLAELFAKKDANGLYDWTPGELDESKAIGKELEDLQPKLNDHLKAVADERKNAEELKALNTVVRPAPHDNGGSSKAAGHDGFDLADGNYAMDRNGRIVRVDAGSMKSIGELFTEHAAFKGFISGRQVMEMPDFDVKTLFQTSAGWAPFVQRQPGAVLSPQQQPRVVDMIPTFETSQSAIKWMLETTYTNNAAATAENGTYGESVFALTEQSSPVQKIAVTIPATDEQLDDVPGARDYLNNRLNLQLRQVLDQAILTGSGTPPALKGIANISGIQTQALSTDPLFDCFLKAMTKIQTVGFANPTGAVLHPTNWLSFRLTRTSTDAYVLGSPNDPNVNSLWGIPVVTTTYQTLGTGIVADFATYLELWYRKGISFDMTNSHASEFASGVQRLRAQLRAAFLSTRPTAICTMTGLT